MLPALLAGVPARAQVHVDAGALDRLSGPATPDAPAAKHTAPASHHATHKPTPPPRTASKPPAKAVAKPAPAPPPAPVAIAPAPPAVAVLAPPPPLPPVRPLPPPVIPEVPDAVGDASPIPGGLRVTFGADKAELNPATVAALRGLGKRLAASPDADVNVFAYAAGAADDPSTPRRLSLSRALAARAVLMSENIASTRIYLRALGSTPSQGPPDRVDVQQANLAPAGQLPATAARAP